MAIPTRHEFEKAAELVKAILNGDWTFDRPSWAESQEIGLYDFGYDATYDHETELSARYTRAVWTAEAFIVLFSAANARFDVGIFLHACGLGPKPSRRHHIS